MREKAENHALLRTNLVCYWYVTRANEIPRLRAEYLPGLLYEESDGS